MSFRDDGVKFNSDRLRRSGCSSFGTPKEFRSLRIVCWNRSLKVLMLRNLKVALGATREREREKTRRERERSVPDPPALQNLLSQIRRPLNKKPDLKTICDVTHLVVPH